MTHHGLILKKDQSVFLCFFNKIASMPKILFSLCISPLLTTPIIHYISLINELRVTFNGIPSVPSPCHPIPKENVMFDFLTTCRALADENRIRILMALRGRQLCVCQVTAFLDLAPSTTSKHLSILRQARLIESNKQGRWVYYGLAEDSPRPNIREALAWMKGSLAADPTIIEDEARIAEILRAEEACGFGHGESDCFHSLEVHSLAQRFESAPQEEENHD